MNPFYVIQGVCFGCVTALLLPNSSSVFCNRDSRFLFCHVFFRCCFFLTFSFVCLVLTVSFRLFCLDFSSVCFFSYVFCFVSFVSIFFVPFSHFLSFWSAVCLSYFFFHLFIFFCVFSMK